MRTFLAEIGTGKPAAYLGDDSADESAFQAMQGHGITVLVRSTLRPTAAEFWLKPPEELVAFLELWLKACAGRTELDSDASGAATAVADRRLARISDCRQDPYSWSPPCTPVTQKILPCRR